ncbi:MAG: NADH-quinone oxidoreductase subunit J, partial [Planctomycetota bacterium]
MTLESALFAAFAGGTLGGALGVVLTTNVVRAAFWLMVSLGSVSGLYFLCGADLVGATQLLIYVGGTVVLLVFGVMLTATGPYVRAEVGIAERLGGGLVGLLLLTVLVGRLAGVDWAATPGAIAEAPPHAGGGTTSPLGLKLLGITDVPGGESGFGFLLPFEIVSVHLLAVLVAAAYLARAKRSRDD